MSVAMMTPGGEDGELHVAAEWMQKKAVYIRSVVDVVTV